VPGSPTAYSPAFKVFARVRYDWTVGEHDYFVQANGDHQDHMITSTGYISGYDIPGFSTYGAAAGLSGRAWGVQVYAQNLTNVDASATTDSGQFVLVKVPIRPRVFGLSMTYSFQEK